MNHPMTDEDLLSPWRLHMPELRSPYEPPREAYEQPLDPSWTEIPPEEAGDNESNPFQIPEVVSASYTRYPFASPLIPPLHLSENDWLNQRDNTCYYPSFGANGDIRATSDTVNYLTHRTSQMNLSSQSNTIGTALPKQGVIRTPRKTKQYISYFDQLEQKYVDPSQLRIGTQVNLTQALRQTKIGRSPKPNKTSDTDKSKKERARRKA